MLFDIKSLLIDNWTIEKAMANYREGDLNEIKRIMCFMVLWDDVYYMDNPATLHWKERVDDNLSAENNNIHYVPVDERAVFIEKHGIRDILFSRNEIIDSVNRDIMEYYKNSAEIIHNANLELGLESLYIMINNEKNKTSDFSDKIIALKNKPMVKQFRKWADGFESDIKKGKILVVDKYLEELKEIQNMEKDVRVTGELFPIPTLKIELQPGLRDMMRGLSPQFLFPCYLYRKGIENAREIIFPHQSILEKSYLKSP